MPSFHELVGQQRAVAILQSFLKKKAYPQALLFEGESGVGKRKAADIFAQMIFCDAASMDITAPCGTCLSCQKIQHQSHPDLLILAPEENAIRIDQVRKMQQQIIYKPAAGSTKVVLIDPAEKMNGAAANSLLKTLEEPPPYVVLILICAEGGVLLPTIRSRCQSVQFHALSFSQIKTVLMEEKGWTANEAHLVTATAFGRLSAARDMAIETARETDEERHTLVSTGDLFETAAHFSGDRDALETALLYLMHWLRDVLLVQSLKNGHSPDDAVLFYPWRRAELKAWGTRMTTSEIHRFLSDAQRVYTAQTRNVNRPLSLETLLLHLRKSPEITAASSI
ncbi:MAG: DNA polymerase III subunit delta' [Nitrospiria bacterium]